MGIPGTDISERAQFLLKALIERHIRDGQPVGSRTLQQELGLPLSPATIRNVLSDLEERGYLASPHTSAGRVPTSRGYRFFVDSLLQVRPLDAQAVEFLRAELDPDKSASELVQTASSLLSTITSQVGLVSLPKATDSQLRHVEFLPLSGDRVLVILVIDEREVENRIIHTQRAYTEDELRDVAALINQRYAGRSLRGISEDIVREMQDAQSRIDRYMQATLDLARQALQRAKPTDDEYLVAGERQLLDQVAPDEIDKLRGLFDAFERKRDVLHLLERCARAEGIHIFIGEEAGYEVFGDYSVVTAPYSDGRRPLGVLGVIGPTRMAYERVIPIVDVTARMLTAALAR
jgi:heat-inducible transcriptional repressor